MLDVCSYSETGVPCDLLQHPEPQASGLNNLDQAAPAMQMVFQYSILLPDHAQPAGGGSDAAAKQRCIGSER